MRGLVAQLVEQSPEKACVGGSNPPQTTIFYLQFIYSIDNQPSIEMTKKIYLLIDTIPTLGIRLANRIIYLN